MFVQLISVKHISLISTVRHLPRAPCDSALECFAWALQGPWEPWSKDIGAAWSHLESNIFEGRMGSLNHSNESLNTNS